MWISDLKDVAQVTVTVNFGDDDFRWPVAWVSKVGSVYFDGPA